MGSMSPARFALFNIAGAVLWVALLCYAGFFFGNVPWIRHNLSLMIVGIVLVSLVPVAVAWWRGRSA
jgi:membrane-associated protein